MSKAAGQPSTNALSRGVDLLVEHRIKLDALEHVLKETNPLVHELRTQMDHTISCIYGPSAVRSERHETKSCLRQPRAMTP